jgi:cytochrome c oxidase subunit II
VPGLPLWPTRASAYAGQLDFLFICLLVISFLTAGLVIFLLILFAAKYRHTSTAPRDEPTTKTWRWEVGWTAASLLIFVALAIWGASFYLRLYNPPADALQIFVVGKQWMWKAQHPGGQREINELHVPLGETVRLLLTSQDVIHSFFVPAFRVKHDVLPGQYETFWFKPTEVGRFRLECTQYCGTEHAHMGGDIVVMPPADYARWLSRQGEHESLAQQGEALFRKYGCSGCHGANSTVHAPPLAGVYGGLVHLEGGDTVRADERYIRDSILLPRSQIVAGYPPVMPSFAGQIGEDDLVKLVAYIQSLSPIDGASQ